MLERAERQRREVAGTTAREHKSALGQFMTPRPTAEFMAALFDPFEGDMRLLDAGAGLGALTCAVVDRWLQEASAGHAELVAYELDSRLRGHLEETLATYVATGRVSAEVHGDDFVARGVVDAVQRRDTFTHAILNPPYKKIGSDSSYRRLFRRLGLETVNLYSGFVATALSLLAPGGQLVAIIPRSFCNGPYYRPFRDFVLERAALRHIHLFESRDRAFKDDKVLQENVIIRLDKFADQSSVAVSVSTDDGFSDLNRTERPFETIVVPHDPERFIHIASNEAPDRLSASTVLKFTLRDLGIDVSTGPVVDFRLRDHLTKEAEVGAVPLLYPVHFEEGVLCWPKPDIKKWNGIRSNPDTLRWLMPNDGWYVVTRRFSSKEEKRRLVPSLVDPAGLSGHQSIGFENHLNVLHRGRHGLEEDLARGLAVYLGSTLVDDHFRRFNGHTQVNATDLRSLRYPSIEALKALGAWSVRQDVLLQESVDARVEALLA